MENKRFKDWIRDEWSIHGGLIIPATAAKILEMTRGGIASYQKSGKVKVYLDPEGKTMLSFVEVLKLAEENDKTGKTTARRRKTRKNAVSVENSPITDKN